VYFCFLESFTTVFPFCAWKQHTIITPFFKFINFLGLNSACCSLGKRVISEIMEEEKGKQPLLERKKYYENCPGCKVDKAKELSEGQGVPFTELFIMWMVALSAGIRNSHYSEFLTSAWVLFWFFFVLLKLLGCWKVWFCWFLKCNW